MLTLLFAFLIYSTIVGSYGDSNTHSTDPQVQEQLRRTPLPRRRPRDRTPRQSSKLLTPLQKRTKTDEQAALVYVVAKTELHQPIKPADLSILKSSARPRPPSDFAATHDRQATHESRAPAPRQSDADRSIYLPFGGSAGEGKKPATKPPGPKSILRWRRISARRRRRLVGLEFTAMALGLAFPRLLHVVPIQRYFALAGPPGPTGDVFGRRSACHQGCPISRRLPCRRLTPQRRDNAVAPQLRTIQPISSER